jgi:hypothetical protein
MPARRSATASVLLGLLVLVALVLALPASAARAATSLVTFGVQPATAAGTDGRPYFSYGVTAGASLSDHVAVLNYSSVPLTLDVYAADALNTATGGLSLLPAAKRPVDAGSWLSLGAGRLAVRVPPRTAGGPGRVIVPFAVTVPARATPGDHVGGIVASLDTVSKNASGANVRLDQRIASRVYFRVAGALKPSLAVDNVRATYAGSLNPVGRGAVTVTYSVHNTGNVKLGGHQSVAVQGLLGQVEAGQLPDVGLLLPGGSETVTVVVPGVFPALLMNATVTVTPTKLASDSDPALGPVTASAHFWAVPWALLVLLLLLGGGTWAYLRRRARPVASATPDDKVPAMSTASRVRGRLKGAGAAGLAALTSLTSLTILAGVVALLASLVLAPAALAETSKLPYADANAVGYLGLCDKSGHSVDHGSIHDKPFVWRAVSSTPAPAPYNGRGRTATLLAFQPRVQTAPGQWSGDMLTASAKYTNAAHPMAQATAGDESLADFLDEYPTMLGGLLQLRVYLGVPDQPPYTLKYAATDIKVSGDTWTVVHGGNVSCTSGTAVSLEALLPASPSASPSVSPAPSTAAPATPSAASSVAAPSSTPDAVAAGNTSGSAGDAGSSQLSAASVALVAVALVLVGIGALLGASSLRNRRRRTPS